MKIENYIPTIKQALLFLVLAVAVAVVRHGFPNSISWKGYWPTSSTSAEDAYKMMAQEGDPAFLSLQGAIEIHRKNEAIFLDARASKDFIAGRIPGSRNLPFYEIEEYQEKALQGLEADTPIVIYCEGIVCELSFFLGRELQQVGYTNILIFYGGYPEWSEAGLEIER
ncbi:hypothetical protein BVX98_02230 [bacterium F11]|nr:hypothetical protein BVX98_02230 [bacterium F11]